MPDLKDPTSLFELALLNEQAVPTLHGPGTHTASGLPNLNPPPTLPHVYPPTTHPIHNIPHNSTNTFPPPSNLPFTHNMHWVSYMAHPFIQSQWDMPSHRTHPSTDHRYGDPKYK